MRQMDYLPPALQLLNKIKSRANYYRTV